MRSLSEVLGVVTQDPFLLHASIAENLLFARPEATVAQIVEAARIAQLHDLIAALPDSYDTVVGERGHRFFRRARDSVSPWRAPSCAIPGSCCSTRRRARSTNHRPERAVVEALARPGKPRTTITIAHACRPAPSRPDRRAGPRDGGRERNARNLLARDGAYARLVRKAA